MVVPPFETMAMFGIYVEFLPCRLLLPKSQIVGSEIIRQDLSRTKEFTECASLQSRIATDDFSVEWSLYVVYYSYFLLYTISKTYSTFLKTNEQRRFEILKYIIRSISKATIKAQ